MLNLILFYIFATILIVSAITVVTTKNPVHAVLFLVLTFVTSSSLWLMLNVEFLALALVFIYVGAVMVLFLFVVMMLDIDIEEMRSGFWQNLPLALFLGLVILAEMIIVLVTKPIVIKANEAINHYNMQQLFLTLYTEYSYPVELASLILLLGLIVAVALAMRDRNKNTKVQNIQEQLKANPKNRLELVKMKAEIESEELTLSNKIEEK